MAQLNIQAWARDCFSIDLIENGELITSQDDGYMPYFQGALGGGGDALSITIDIETGQILGWKPMTVDQICGIME